MSVESGASPSRRIRVIAALAALATLCLLPPLGLEAQLIRSVSRIGAASQSHAIDTLTVALQAEYDGAAVVVVTAGDTTLTEFQRKRAWVVAQEGTDAALSELSKQEYLGALLQDLATQIQRLRRAVARDTTLPVADFAGRVSAVDGMLAALRTASLSESSTDGARAMDAAAVLSSLAHDWARGGAAVRNAHTAEPRAFTSVAEAQTGLTSLHRAVHRIRSLNALQQASTLSAIDAALVRVKGQRLSARTIIDAATRSVVSYDNTTTRIPTSFAAPSSALRQEFTEATRQIVEVAPPTALEIAQLSMTCCAIVCAIAAAGVVVYVLATGLGTDGTSGREAAIEHMTSAFSRVVRLMNRSLAFDCTDLSDAASGPALSAVEAELRGLLKPLATSVAHVPRSLLIAHGSSAAQTEGLLKQLNEQPGVRHSVSIMSVDLTFINDVSFSGDTIKSLPARAQRLRATILSEVLRRGGVLVATPLNRWAFAWNLHGGDKGGIQAAVQCAMATVTAGTVDYPSMQVAVTTGTVAVGAVGSATYKTGLIAGTPVLLAPLALRVAKAHGAGLIADAETHANCTSQTYRSRPIEVVAAETGSAGVVLYNMLSSLDSHDQRLLQWNAAFEKYHTGRVREAVDAFKAWAREGSDASVRRLIGQLEQSPPCTVTVGEAPVSVFA